MAEGATGAAAVIQRERFEEVAERLKIWLPTRRWFGGKGRAIRGVALADQATLGGEDAVVVLALVDVAYEEGEPERYFLPLRARPGGPLAEYEDALTEQAACRAILAAVEGVERIGTERGGWIVFERDAGLDTLGDGLGPSSARPLGAEQSNTSIVFGDAVIMKAFRRVPHGPNPDLEVPRFLAHKTGFASVPRLAGAIEYRGPDGTAGSLAILQEFVKSRGDGWSTTLRALVAGDTAADGHLVGELRALGRVTAELHLALASAPGEPDFAPEPVGLDDLRAWRDGVVDRIERACRALRRPESGLSEDAAGPARRVLAGEAELSQRADGLLGLAPGALAKTRFHGDYHLGQVLATEQGWMVLDFEGEPLRSLSERRAKHCPLKDVAGMLRSFSYARQAALLDTGGAGPGPSADVLAGWEQAARTAYLEAYFARAGTDAVFLPSGAAATRALLGAFELEKAAYELEYELNNRPDWVALPLSYLGGLLEE